jgi:hypothetical protein
VGLGGEIAIDSKQKRACVLVIGAPARGQQVFPTGTVDQAAQEENCWRYCGILAATVIVIAQINYYATVSEPSYPVATVT